MALILLYKRFCIGNEENSPLEITKEFKTYASSDNRLWTKEETMKFIVDHLPNSTDSEVERQSINKASKLMKSYESPSKILQPIREESKSVNALQDHLTDIESKIHMLSRSQYDSVRLSSSNSAREEIMKIIIRTGLDDDTVRLLGYGHKCGSGYCVLCKKKYS